MRLIIPKDREGDWQHIINACQHLKIEAVPFDIYASDWIDRAKSSGADGCLYRPEYRFQSWRQIFGERIKFLNETLGMPVYPSLDELSLYESKRNMAYWLKQSGFPHPSTHIFGSYAEAENFIRSATFPIIHKTDFGNCGQGVRIVRKPEDAIKIARKTFNSGYRVPSYDVENIDLWRRFKHIVRPFYRRIFSICDKPADIELDSVIFQEFIEISTEWRIVKIGRKYFGHDKLPNSKGLRSGGGETSWAVPPVRIFNLAQQICEVGKFNSMSLDIFEDVNGHLFVNELQTVFGVVANNQMYRVISGDRVGFSFEYDAAKKSWTEELGEFGQDYCYRLRAKDFVHQIILEEGGASTDDLRPS